MMLGPAVSSMSLQVWSSVFHWHPQELATHAMHLKHTHGITVTDGKVKIFHTS